MLRPDKQYSLDKYVEICNNIALQCILSKKRQQSLECEQSAKMMNKLKNTFCWLLKREYRYKTSLSNLKKEKRQLQRVLADVQHKRDQIELLYNVRVSKLQDEIDQLRIQVVQLEDKLKQQLMLRHECRQDKIVPSKHFIGKLNAKLFSKWKKEGKTKRLISEHPAFTSDEEENKQKCLRSSGLQVNKRRKLFHEDKETATDI